jgi:hypothetical protein
MFGFSVGLANGNAGRAPGSQGTLDVHLKEI